MQYHSYFKLIYKLIKFNFTSRVADTNYSKELNNSIKKYGTGFGPTLTNLILNLEYNRDRINKESYKILLNRNEVIDLSYNKSIKRKLYDIFKVLISKEVRLSKNKDKILNSLSLKSFENIRSIINSYYNKTNINNFNLSKETIQALNSKMKLPKNDYIKFGLVNDYLISYRKKKDISIRNKINLIYNKYINENQNKPKSKNKNLENFILDLVSKGDSYWEDFSLYEECYGDLNKLMLGDIYGLKIIDLNQERAEERMNELVNSKYNTKISGFKVINERFDDHRCRLDSKRPGGIHYTLVDLGEINFPLEVQFQGIRSFIYDRYGPNSHNLYTFKNKKENLE